MQIWSMRIHRDAVPTACLMHLMRIKHVDPLQNLLSKYANNYAFCTLKFPAVVRAPGTRATMENLQSIVLVCDPLCWGHMYLNNVYTEFLKGRRCLFGDVSCHQIRNDSPYVLMSGTVDGCQRELTAEGSTIT